MSDKGHPPQWGKRMWGGKRSRMAWGSSSLPFEHGMQNETWGTSHDNRVGVL